MNKKALLLTALLSSFFVGLLTAQINAYAKVTGITSGSVLAVSNVNQTSGNFVVGQQVVVMQMQGATLSDNTNASTFGSLASLNSAGLYEVRTISAINAGTTVITVTPQVQNTYATADNVQIISFPRLGTAAFTTSANITGLAWNGNVGGVVAFWVNGNLNLNHNISANALGFRGGAKFGQDGGNCETSVFRIAAGNARYANKGEGICFINTNTSWVAGRAKIVNGGGAGIVHNGGGGGGGNFSAGGAGYLGYSGLCNATTNAGGQGGLAISSSASRVFMGGGGGGGQENNGTGSNGGNGGGIILIECDTIVISGACAARVISANGASVATGGNDGQGGGGAGGSIVLDIRGMRIQTGCPLTVSGNGGSGGSVNSDPHGSGGGGGQGAIYIRAGGPFTNAVLATISGTGGAASNAASPPLAGSGSGTPGSGVSTGNSTIPLPVTLTSFGAQDIGEMTAEIIWQTASEKQNREFQLYHSTDSENWTLLTRLDGKGTYSGASSYRYLHRNVAAGRQYYQLRQLDEDGTLNKVGICTVLMKDQISEVRISPNPCSDQLILKNVRPFLSEDFKLCDGIGNCVPIKGWISNDYSLSFDVSGFQQGVYFLSSQSLSLKVIIVR